MKTVQKKPLVNLFWTGGWDSTFRVLQLADKNVIIQPYYLLDSGRESQQIELDTIAALTHEILSKDKTRCFINELITERAKDLPEDPVIWKAYKTMRRSCYFGSQYDYLARFAKKVDNLELSVHKDDKALVIINKFGGMVRQNDSVTGKNYALDADASSPDLIKVFGSFLFPLLDYTKLEMKREAEEQGFIDLMNQTWFCHYPINNEPCGSCNPCAYTIEEGMAYRFSKAALLRYRLRKLRGLIRKILTVTGLLFNSESTSAVGSKKEATS